jgi:hypothetical protein
MQWIQNSSQTNANITNNVSRDANSHSTNKKKECLKANIDYLETNSKIKNIRCLYRPIKDFN